MGPDQFNFWLFEQVLDTQNAGIAKLKAQPFVRLADQAELVGKAIKGVVHLRRVNGEIDSACRPTLGISDGAESRPLHAVVGWNRSLLLNRGLDVV